MIANGVLSNEGWKTMHSDLQSNHQNGDSVVFKLSLAQNLLQSSSSSQFFPVSSLEFPLEIHPTLSGSINKTKSMFIVAYTWNNDIHLTFLRFLLF